MSSELKVDTISEKTSTNGVVVDGVTIKDGAIAGSFISGLSTGKVLQVIEATSSTLQDTTSTSYIDITNITLDITPSATSSKIFVLYTDMNRTTRTNDVSAGSITLQILRDSTQIAQRHMSMYNSAGGNGSNTIATSTAMSKLDSPSTTSQITYKVQMKAASSATISSQYSNETASLIAMEIGA